jgi:hypothetical protein
MCTCVAVDVTVRFKFYRFDISLQLLERPSVLNYLLGLVGGQAPLASHTISLPARCAALAKVLIASTCQAACNMLSCS